jgi:prophage regulatory protein
MPALIPQPESPVRQMLTVREVADHFGVGVSTLYALMARGEFPRPERIGRRMTRFNAEKLNAWIDAGCPGVKDNEDSIQV